MKNIIKYNTLPLLVLLVMLIITIFAYYSVDKESYNRRQNLLDFKVNQAQADISNSIQTYIQILKAGKGLFKVTDTITRQEWKDYVESMEIEQNFPGIQGIGYAVFLKPGNIGAYELKVQQEGFNDFKIFPEGEREVYSSILYLEPFIGRNMRAFGFDMYSNPTRRDAMLYAIENNLPAVSGKVELVQETIEDVQSGFLIYLPVYIKNSSRKTVEERKSAIKGFVFSPFRMNDFMNSILDEEFEDLDIKIYDGKSLSKERLLYHKNPDDSYNSSDADIKPVVKNINFNNRSWTIQYIPLPEFGSRTDYYQPLLVLGSGIIISLLIASVISLLSYARRKALAELEKTKEMEHKKDEFIGIASHELKTPLTSSKAYMELLKMSASNEEDSKLAGKALESLNKLSLLVNDLLDVTKIQAGMLKLNYTEFNIHTVIDLAIENVYHSYSTHLIIKKGYMDPIYTNGDLIRLEQAIVNLLSNAIKYSPDADSIEVEVRQLKQEVEVSIKDYGIGISKEDYEKIFEKFYRVEGLDENITGLGMGLHIAAEIIYRHNGKFWVESEIGKGSVFYFTLPIIQGN